MSELENEAVWMLSDEFENSELSEALYVLWHDSIRRQLLGARAKEIILERHAPDKCALRYFKAIEGFYKKSETATARLIEAITEVDQLSQSDDGELRSLAADISANFPLFNFGKRLFLDVTVT